MLYGNPTKHIRHSNEASYTLGPQRFIVHTFWRYSGSAAARTDGDDLSSSTGANMPEGSKVTAHKTEILVTPETIEPQQLYIGRIKLSFHDVYSPAICGGRFQQASWGDTSTENFDADGTDPITPHLYPDDATADKIYVTGAGSEYNIGTPGSTYATSGGIQAWKLDDHIKHFINLKKVTVFDQRPLMGERWQRIPSKVKRINEGTFYGLFIFNDSVRGATPADTQVKINIKDFIREKAI